MIKMFTAREICVIGVTSVKSADPDQLRRRDAAAGLSLHFLHMSEGPFSHYKLSEFDTRTAVTEPISGL